MNRQSSSWDLNRFVKTLSYFGAVPILSQIDWFQQWFGSRPDPTVDSRLLLKRNGEASLVISPPPSVPASTMPQTILIAATGDRLTALVDRLLPQERPIRVLSLNGENLLREGVESVTIDLQQPPSAELLADVGTIVCAIESPALSETVVQFLIEAISRSELRSPIFDFSDRSTNLAEIWGALDDVVMGGVSQSGIRLSNDVADFSGQVSTANNGGFASVRTRNLEPPIDLTGYDGIELLLQGDGNRYKFMLRGETQWDGVAHCASFDTIANQFMTVRVPFCTLIPVFRARTLPDVPLKLDRIRAFQLMLSKFEYDGGLNPRFQPGFFQLQVRSISAYQQQFQRAIVLVSPRNSKAEIWLRQSGLKVKILHSIEGEAAAKVAEDCLRAIEDCLKTIV